MRHLRSIAALLAIAAVTVACGSSSSSGGESQGTEPSTGSQPSQAAASSGGGDGGGGGGANGSMTYEITGDYQASGELPFLAGGTSLWVEQLQGWAAYFADQGANGKVIQINTQTAEGSTGMIWNYGDGTALVIATSDPSTGGGCEFNLTKNDPSGTAGSIDCDAIYTLMTGAGGNGTVHVSAEWDGHN